jgi:putative transcriptional regulator
MQPVPRPAAPSDGIHRGVLLIAERKLQDPNFSRSVVLITHFDETGTAGLILNRPLPVPAAEVLPPLAPIEPEPGGLFLGGPVGVDTLQLLVRTEADLGPESRIVDGVHLVTGVDRFQDLVDGRIQTKALRLYAGYAGWGPGQLESELLRGDWILWASDADTIFSPEPARLWPELIGRASEQWVQAGPPGGADATAPAQYNPRFATGREIGSGSARGAVPHFHGLLSGMRLANQREPGACGRGRQPKC